MRRIVALVVPRTRRLNKTCAFGGAHGRQECRLLDKLKSKLGYFVAVANSSQFSRAKTGCWGNKSCVLSARKFCVSRLKSIPISRRRLFMLFYPFHQEGKMYPLLCPSLRWFNEIKFLKFRVVLLGSAKSACFEIFPPWLITKRSLKGHFFKLRSV